MKHSTGYSKDLKDTNEALIKRLDALEKVLSSQPQHFQQRIERSSYSHSNTNERSRLVGRQREESKEDNRTLLTRICSNTLYGSLPINFDPCRNVLISCQHFSEHNYHIQAFHWYQHGHAWEVDLNGVA